MRPGNGVSPHMRDQFIWNKLWIRRQARRIQIPERPVLATCRYSRAGRFLCATAIFR